MIGLIRTFSAPALAKKAAEKAMKTLVCEGAHSNVFVWRAEPGQEIPAHTHPRGQDTWTVISGSAEYYKGGGEVVRVKAGDIAVARAGEVHGAMNNGKEPFIFVSVVSPADAGYDVAAK